jgi:hypothetical protein
MNMHLPDNIENNTPATNLCPGSRKCNVSPIIELTGKLELSTKSLVYLFMSITSRLYLSAISIKAFDITVVSCKDV